MVPISKNGNKNKHQIVNFVDNETQLHLFNHCTATLKRYERRHDSIIQTIMNSLVITTSDTCRLYADIIGYECPSILFRSKRTIEKSAEIYRSRPDIIIRERNCISVIELTCPLEKIY